MFIAIGRIALTHVVDDTVAPVYILLSYLFYFLYQEISQQKMYKIKELASQMKMIIINFQGKKEKTYLYMHK
jgi:hypothetical protein